MEFIVFISFWTQLNVTRQSYTLHGVQFVALISLWCVDQYKYI